MIIRYSRVNASLYDDFNRANNAGTPGPADSGQPVVVTSGTAIITGNALGASVAANIYWDLGSKDFRFQFKIGLLPAGKSAFYQVRSDNVESSLIYGGLDASGIELREFVDPADTFIQNNAHAVAAGDIVEIIAKGLNFKVLVNGVRYIDGNVSSLSGGTLVGLSLDVGVTIDWMRAVKI